MATQDDLLDTGININHDMVGGINLNDSDSDYGYEDASELQSDNDQVDINSNKGGHSDTDSEDIIGGKENQLETLSQSNGDNVVESSTSASDNSESDLDSSSTDSESNSEESELSDASDKPDLIEEDEETKVKNAKAALASMKLKKSISRTTDKDILKEADPVDKALPLEYVINKLSSEGIVMRHHIESFNSFVKYIVPSTFDVLSTKLANQDFSYGSITSLTENINFDIRFTNLSVKPQFLNNIAKPRIATPSDCRRMGLTYSISIHADIEVSAVLTESQTRSKETVIFKDKHLFRLPNMVQSATCVLSNKFANDLELLGESSTDLGGYFIINGKEKVLIAQEVSAYNVLQSNAIQDIKLPYSHTGLIRTIQDEDDPFPKELRFNAFRIDHATRAGAIVIDLSGLKEKVALPLAVLFKALGIVNDRDIVDIITLTDPDVKWEERIRPTLVDGAFIETQESAMRFIESLLVSRNKASKDKLSGGRTTDQQVQNAVMTWLYRDLLPMIVTDGLYGKAQNIGMYALKFLKVVYGEQDETDRESQTVKRFNTSGDLLAQVLRDATNDYRQSIINNIINQRQATGGHKTLDSLLKGVFNTDKSMILFNENLISTIFHTSFVKDWGMRKQRAIEKDLKQNFRVSTQDLDKPADADGAAEEVGIVQDLNRLSHFGYLSHSRRTNFDLDDTVKLRRPRELHVSQFGYFCHIDAPDGTNSGKLKHLAVAASITVQLPPNIRDRIKLLIVSSCMKTIHMKALPSGSTKVYLDGMWIGFVLTPNIFVDRFRALRSSGIISKWVNIRWDVRENEIEVRTVSGRATRLLLTPHGHLNPKVLDVESIWVDKSHLLRLSGEPRINNGHSKMISHTDEQARHNVMATDIATASESDVTAFFESLHESRSKWDWIDVVEMQNCLICFDHNTTDERVTHIEPHPSTIHSFNANLIPFVAHNSTVRPLYACAQVKHLLYLLILLKRIK